MTGLRGRIASDLGWTVEDTKTFSLATLRAWVHDPVLRADIDDFMQQGRHILRNRRGRLHFPDPLA